MDNMLPLHNGDLIDRGTKTHYVQPWFTSVQSATAQRRMRPTKKLLYLTMLLPLVITQRETAEIIRLPAKVPSSLRDGAEIRSFLTLPGETEGAGLMVTIHCHGGNHNK